jgi:hypothetical protein
VKDHQAERYSKGYRSWDQALKDYVVVFATEWASEIYPTGQSFTPMIHGIILEPEKWHVDCPTRIALVHAANPFSSNANSEEVLRAWQKIPFIVWVIPGCKRSWMIQCLI